MSCPNDCMHDGPCQDYASELGYGKSRPYTVGELAGKTVEEMSKLASLLPLFRDLADHVQCAANNGEKLEHFTKDIECHLDALVSRYIATRQWTDQLLRSMKDMES